MPSRLPVSVRRIHPPFERAVTQCGQPGAPWRSLGLGCAFRLRWPRQGRRAGEGGVGATRLQLRYEEGRKACPFGRRVGDSADRWRGPHTTADRRRARVRPGLIAVSAVCHSAVCRPDALTRGLGVLLQTDDCRLIRPAARTTLAHSSVHPTPANH